MTKFAFPNDFECIVVNEDDTEIVLRSNINCIKDIDHWVRDFGLLNNTKWNSRDSVPKGKQMLCM